jgi:predicted RND superfamily exporter protein
MRSGPVGNGTGEQIERHMNANTIMLGAALVFVVALTLGYFFTQPKGPK